MSNKFEKVRGWFGIVLIAWPILKIAAKAAGFDLPDLPAGIGDFASVISGVAGTTMLANAAPVGKKSRAKFGLN